MRGRGNMLNLEAYHFSLTAFLCSRKPFKAWTLALLDSSWKLRCTSYEISYCNYCIYFSVGNK